jgi:hypothetical protein
MWPGSCATLPAICCTISIFQRHAQMAANTGNFSLLRYALCASVASLGSGVLASAIVRHHLSNAATTLPAIEAGWLPFAGAVIFSPLVETLLFVYSRRAINSVSDLSKSAPPRFAFVLALQAILFSSLHAVWSAYWGLILLVPGFIFSWVFLVWSARRSEWAGYAASALTHSIHNAIVALSFML